MNQSALSSLIWSVAELLRGDYKQADYGKVILPFTVLRRLDCVLAPTKAMALAEHSLRKGQGMNPEPFVLRKVGLGFANTSDLDLRRLLGDADQIGPNLHAYVRAFTPAVRDVFERFEFATQVERLARAGLLYQVAERFAAVTSTPTGSRTRRWASSSRS